MEAVHLEEKGGDDKAEPESATASGIAVRARGASPSRIRSANLEHHRKPVKPARRPARSPNSRAGRQFGEQRCLGGMGNLPARRRPAGPDARSAATEPRPARSGRPEAPPMAPASEGPPTP